MRLRTSKPRRRRASARGKTAPGSGACATPAQTRSAAPAPPCTAVRKCTQHRYKETAGTRRPAGGKKAVRLSARRNARTRTRALDMALIVRSTAVRSVSDPVCLPRCPHRLPAFPAVREPARERVRSGVDVIKSGQKACSGVCSGNMCHRKHTADFGNKESASGRRFWLGSVSYTVPE